MHPEDQNLPCPQAGDPIFTETLMAERETGPGKPRGGRKPGRNLLIGLVILFLIFVLPRFFSQYRPETAEPESDRIVFEHLLLGDQLPRMEDAHGEVRTDNLDCLHLYFLDVDQKKCDDYLHLCKSRGFQEDDHQLPGELRLFKSAPFTEGPAYSALSSHAEDYNSLYYKIKL